MSSGRSAVVVGAGIAGLAAALKLARTGWRVTVVERAAGLRGGAYVVGFSGLGYAAAERLGLLPELRRLESPWRPARQVDGDGRVQAALTVPVQQVMTGRRTISILRGDLERVLYDAVDGSVECRFGLTVTDVDQRTDGVTVTFSDGTQTSADLLVGADGLHSTVRRLVFGPEERFRYDFGAYVVSFELADPPAELADRTTFLSLVGRGAGVYPQRNGSLAAFFVFASDRLDGHPSGDVVPALRQVYGDLGWAWPELVESAGRAESVYVDSISQVRMSAWTSGHVALVGDSAWAVSLLAGYGSSLAVGGAELLGNLLDETGDVPAELSGWDRRLRPLVHRKQLQGRWSRDLFIPRSQVSVTARRALLGLAGSRPATALAGRVAGGDHA